jgi:hypothetical protein
MSGRGADLTTDAATFGHVSVGLLLSRRRHVCLWAAKEFPMPNQPLRSAASPNRRLAVLLCFAVLLVVAGAGGLAYWGSVKFLAEPPGLGGTWYDPADPKHTYRFRANGDMDAWYGTLPMDHFLTWQRDGQRITIRTTRHWDFVGQLDGGEISGKMILRDQTGAAESQHGTVWRRQ